MVSKGKYSSRRTTKERYENHLRKADGKERLMTGFNGSFDASQFAPRQGGEAHPVGMYPFTITDTKLVETKDKTVKRELAPVELIIRSSTGKPGH